MRQRWVEPDDGGLVDIEADEEPDTVGELVGLPDEAVVFAQLWNDYWSDPSPAGWFALVSAFAMVARAVTANSESNEVEPS